VADSKNDITSEVSTTEVDIAEAKKVQFAENPNTRLPRPAQVAEIQSTGLNSELVQQLKMGRKAAMFSGMLRCIQIVDANTPHAHHCMSPVVNNLTTNEALCTRCTKQQNPGVAQPRVINSSMIRLPATDLQELGLTEDPLFGKFKPEGEAPKKSRQNPAKVAGSPRRAKHMPVPNSVKIEVTMSDLKSSPNPAAILLQKTLDAIFELPVKNFREAEEIRVVKERVETLLSQQGETPQ